MPSIDKICFLYFVVPRGKPKKKIEKKRIFLDIVEFVRGLIMEILQSCNKNLPVSLMRLLLYFNSPFH